MRGILFVDTAGAQMRAKVQKWGNSLAIRVPKPFAEQLGLRQDSDVDVLVEDRELVVKPVGQCAYSLDELLAKATDNLHGEVETSGAVGDEHW